MKLLTVLSIALPTLIANANAYAVDYLGPTALAVSNDGKTLYVANTDARQVTRVELLGGKITQRIKMPGEPTGLAIDSTGNRLIVTCASPDSTVTILDAKTGNSQAVIPVGHTAMSPTVSPGGHRLYVCNRFDNDVSVIDLDELREVARVPTIREPIAAAITPDSRLVLVANHLPNQRTDFEYQGDVAAVVTLLDTKTLETTEIILPHGSNGLRDICISPDGKRALVTHLLSNFQSVPFRVDTGWINTNVVSMIDIPNRKLVSTIGMDEYYEGAGNPWGVTWSADGNSVCVSLSGTGELSRISSVDLLGDVAHRTMQPMMAVWPIYPSLGESLWQRVKLPGDGQRGMAVAGSKVYVAQYFSDSVAVLDLKDNSIDTIALGPQPELTQARRGELLFHSADICYQHWQSCASCHPDGRADALSWDLMNDGVGNSKNTKSMLLSHRTPPAMAEGVRESAEVAVRSGITHILFTERPADEADAIDSYLKSLKPVPSPHLIDGHLSDAAARGRELFQSQRIACNRCHPTPLYTDLRSHNVGTRRRIERQERFDTPSLVEIWRTAPYLHDGRYISIRELLVDGRHGLRRAGSELSEQDLNDLIEFVLSI